jgi:hypothetical protein
MYLIDTVPVNFVCQSAAFPEQLMQNPLSRFQKTVAELSRPVNLDLKKRPAQPLNQNPVRGDR